MTKMDISKGFIEQENHYLKRRIERLSTQIEELLSKNYPNQNLQNQKIMKEAIENKEERKYQKGKRQNFFKNYIRDYYTFVPTYC